MATSEMRAKLVLEASTKGGEKIEIIVDDLEKLAAAGGEAAPKFQVLAAELRALGQQQALINQFAALKTQTGDYADEAAKAQAATKGAALALKEKRAALAGAVEDEQRLSAALERQRQAQTDIGGAIKTAKDELRQLRAASKEAGADTAVLADRLGDTRAQLARLQVEARESAEQTKALAREQREAGGTMRQIAGDVKALEGGFERARATSVKANKVHADGRVELQRLRDALAAAGVSSGDLAGAQQRVRTEMEQTRGRAAALKKEYAEIGAAATVAAKQQGTSHRKISEGVHSISEELAFLRNAYVGLQTLMGAARGLKGLADTADEVSNLQGRIKVVIGEGQLFAEMWDRVTATALRTNSSLETTGNLFARITTVGKEAGLTTQRAAEQSLAVVETINQAVQLSGAASSASDAALTQLIQGLQSGVLRGDEFNSVMEQAPRLAKALADGLGVATGQLRAMAEEGELTADKVIKALQSQAKAIQGEFATLPATIGRSVQNLSTSWSVFISQTDKAWSASQTVARGIDLVAQNLELLAGLALKAGLAVTAVYAVKALAAARDYLAATMGASKGLDQLAGAGGRATTSVSATSAAMQRFGSIARGIAYAEIASQLLQIAQAYKQLREQQRIQAETQARVTEGQKRVADRLREISAATGITVASMQELNDAQAVGAIKFNQALGVWQSAEQAQLALANAVQKTSAQLASLDAARMVEQFNKLTDEGKKTGEALADIIKSVNFDKSEEIDAFILSLNALQAAGRTSAEETAKAWRAAIDGMNAEQMSKTLARAQMAYGQVSISAERLAEINESVLRQSFENLGGNADLAMGRISKGAKEAIGAVELVAHTAAASGLSIAQTATAVELAFAAAVPKADSLEAIDAIEKQLAAMGEAGKISADGIGRTKEALEKQRAVIEGQLPGIQSLAEALRQLGVKPQSELKAMADSAKAAFKVVSTSGTATKREIDEAWRAMAQSAIEANGGVADASLQAQAAQHGMVIQADEGGKAIVKSMDEAAKSAEGMGNAAKNAGKDAADGAAEAADAADELKKKQQEVTAAFEFTWVTARAGASKYRDEAVAHAEAIEGQWQSVEGRMISSWSRWNDAVNGHFALLGKLADEYAAALDNIDARQQQLNASNGGAARGVADLEMRLIELNGTEDEIARARYERDQAEVRRQIELQKLELERAAIRGEDGGRIQQEIDLLNKQLGLMERVFNEEKKQAKARQRDKNTGSDGGSGGGSSGGSGGGASRGGGAINITVNANGINDPVQLARKLVPELKKLDRLGR